MKRKIFISILVLISPFIILCCITQLQWVSQSTIQSESEKINFLEQNKDAFVCVLKANKRKHQIGEKPDIQVQILNKTDSTVLMVGSLEGSEYEFRLPFSRFIIEHELFGAVKSTFFGCAMTNPLKESNFESVNSKSGFDPYGEQYNYSAQNLKASHFLMPGIYHIKYYYSTIEDGEMNHSINEMIEFDAQMEKLYEAGGREAVLREEKRRKERLDSLWKRIPKIELESNTITIEYDLFTRL